MQPLRALNAAHQELPCDVLVCSQQCSSHHVTGGTTSKVDNQYIPVSDESNSTAARVVKGFLLTRSV